MEHNTCEKLRQAVLSDETLSEELRNHIKECARCKTALAEWKQVQASLRTDSPTKNGITLADAVMKEITEQSFFTSNKKQKSIGRHAFLAAACVLVTCLMLPAILKKKNVEKPLNDIVAETETAQIEESPTYASSGASLGASEGTQISADESDKQSFQSAKSTQSAEKPVAQPKTADNNATEKSVAQNMASSTPSTASATVDTMPSKQGSGSAENVAGTANDNITLMKVIAPKASDSASGDSTSVAVKNDVATTQSTEESLAIASNSVTATDSAPPQNSNSNSNSNRGNNKGNANKPKNSVIADTNSNANNTIDIYEAYDVACAYDGGIYIILFDSAEIAENMVMFETDEDFHIAVYRDENGKYYAEIWEEAPFDMKKVEKKTLPDDLRPIEEELTPFGK